MVALALDIGETRIGIAVSSRDGKMAMPVKVLPAAEVTGMAKTFRYLVEDYEPDILVSGRPLTMAGEPGPQAERVAAVAQKIADELDLPLEFEDERLSSQEAKRLLREQGFEVLLVDVGPGAENDHVRGVAHLGFVERVAADGGFGDPRLAFIAAGDDVVPGLGIDRRRAKAQQCLDLFDDFGRQLAVGLEGFGSATRGGDFGDVHRKKSGRKKG